MFAYGPADATAIPKPRHLLPRLNPDWFYLSGPLPFQQILTFYHYNAVSVEAEIEPRIIITYYETRTVHLMMMMIG